jgi:hypothetical protein
MLVVSLLYRRLIGVGWIAGLAALMYLLADSSYFPTMWLANRNVLISLFFGVLTLILHDRHRTAGGRLSLMGAPACLLLSLLSAEAGIGTLAYLFAYEIVLRNAKTEAVNVMVREPVPGDWTMLDESQPHAKVAAGTAQWLVNVPAGGATTLRYRVLVRY